MNKEELEGIKIKFETKKKERDKLKKAKERLSELKKHPLVKEYIGLMGAGDKKILSDEKILENIIKAANIKNKSNIYVCYGKSFYDGPYINKNNSYYVYRGLEDGGIFSIDQKDNEEFEKDINIIKLLEHDSEYYDKIKQFYFKELLNGNGEEETLEKIKIKSKEFNIKEIKQK